MTPDPCLSWDKRNGIDLYETLFNQFQVFDPSEESEDEMAERLRDLNPSVDLIHALLDLRDGEVMMVDIETMEYEVTDRYTLQYDDYSLAAVYFGD